MFYPYCTPKVYCMPQVITRTSFSVAVAWVPKKLNSLRNWQVLEIQFIWRGHSGRLLIFAFVFELQPILSTEVIQAWAALSTPSHSSLGKALGSQAVTNRNTEFESSLGAIFFQFLFLRTYFPWLGVQHIAVWQCQTQHLTAHWR